jgi:type IV pilus assembly protein PilC
MPTFTYEGVDRDRKKVKGSMDATAEGEVRVFLRSQGIRPTYLARAGTGANLDLGALLRKYTDNVTLAQVLSFSRQFQLLMSSGMPIVQGLELLADQSVGTFKSIILDIRERVSGGSFLWEAFAVYPKVFPKLYISLIRAGEASGSLEQMFKRLCRYMEDADRIRKMVKGAMVYPIVVLSIGMGVAGMMVVFVIPKFEEMLKGTGKKLPAPTQFFIDLSHFMIGNLYPLVFGSIVTIYVLRRYFTSDEGRAFLDRVVFVIPIFGPLSQKSGVARFARTLQTCTTSGVSLLDALDICRMTIDNVVLEAAMAKIRSEVENGKTLGAVVAQIPIFPKMASQMISVGESTGNLDKMLEKVADLYESEVEMLAAGLGKAIEPFVIVFLGAIVGGIMIAMYLPVFQMGGGAD